MFLRLQIQTPEIRLKLYFNYQKYHWQLHNENSYEYFNIFSPNQFAFSGEVV